MFVTNRKSVHILEWTFQDGVHLHCAFKFCLSKAKDHTVVELGYIHCICANEKLVLLLLELLLCLQGYQCITILQLHCFGYVYRIYMYIKNMYVYLFIYKKDLKWLCQEGIVCSCKYSQRIFSIRKSSVLDIL